MKRTLYHGSKDRIVKPLFGAGKPNNDYGLGFYCTESEELAKEWAVAKDHDGWANVYSLEDGDLTVLNLNSGQYCILHWLAVLLENRQFETEYGLPSEAKSYLTTRFAVPYKEADVIIGYRADDSYFTFAQDFISGTISYSQLATAMRLGHLGDQYVLKSRKAFDRIEYVESRPASRSDWLERKISRDHAARQEYLGTLRYRRVPGDLRIDRIIDEGIGPDDERLR
jgi:hypothetical protein